MPSVPDPTPSLSEEEIDDLLYFARTNSLSDLQESLSSLSTTTSAPSPSWQPSQLLFHAVDPSTGNSALHMVSANGHVEIINYILSLLSDPNSSPGLEQEAEGGESTKELLNKQNKAGNTALHYASLNGHLSAVKTLITAGADPSVQNSAGHKAAFEAERAEKAEVAEFLLGITRGREGEGEGVDRGDEDEVELSGEGGKVVDSGDGGEQVKELEKGMDKLSTNGTKP